MGCGASVPRSRQYQHSADATSSCLEDASREEVHDVCLSSPGFEFSAQALHIASDALAVPPLSTVDAHHVPRAGRREASGFQSLQAHSKGLDGPVGPALQKTKPEMPKSVEPWDVDDLSYGPSFGPEELDADILGRLARMPAAFVVGGVLAKTDNCEVHLAAQVSDRTKLVVKRIHRRRSAQPYPTHVNEVRCLERLRHPCIVNLLGVIVTRDTLDILLEYCDGGALRNFVEAGQIETDSLLRVLGDVVSALAFMHGERFAHLDVKPHNVLIKSEGAAWLSLEDLKRNHQESG